MGKKRNLGIIDPVIATNTALEKLLAAHDLENALEFQKNLSLDTLHSAELSTLNADVVTINSTITALDASLTDNILKVSNLTTSVTNSVASIDTNTSWFTLDGDLLTAKKNLYVSGSSNYLYINGTNPSGSYAKYVFKVVDGGVIIEESGSA
tara:strand:+ start:46 stop:501 length:456 start_codon:yes stop_codon:yes gene_type:complete